MGPEVVPSRLRSRGRSGVGGAGLRRAMPPNPSAVLAVRASRKAALEVSAPRDVADSISPFLRQAICLAVKESYTFGELLAGFTFPACSFQSGEQAGDKYLQ